jgi:TPP-dependent pyruvate/acetoin dehydrogenase alpha subunit
MSVYKLTTYILVENNQYAIIVDLYPCMRWSRLHELVCQKWDNMG